MKPQPKPKRETDRKYLKFVKSHECTVKSAHGEWPYVSGDKWTCRGPVDAHHVTPISLGGSDYTAIPLCRNHHDYAHKGREFFEKQFSIKLGPEITLLRNEYASKQRTRFPEPKATHAVKPKVQRFTVTCSCGLVHTPTRNQVTFEVEGLRYWCRKNRDYLVAEL